MHKIHKIMSNFKNVHFMNPYLQCHCSTWDKLKYTIFSNKFVSYILFSVYRNNNNSCKKNTFIEYMHTCESFVTSTNSWMWLFALNKVIWQIDPMKMLLLLLPNYNIAINLQWRTVWEGITWKNTLNYAFKPNVGASLCTYARIWANVCVLLLRDIT